MKQKSSVSNNTVSVRLDKWLWAARFFKNRALARAAIEGGKVDIDGVKSKPGKAVSVGLQLNIRVGFEKKEVIIEKILDKRGSASIAQTLYRETEESIRIRALATEQRKLANSIIQHDQRKPEKNQRRQMQQFKRNQ